MKTAYYHTLLSKPVTNRILKPPVAIYIQVAVNSSSLVIKFQAFYMTTFALLWLLHAMTA